MTQMTNSYENHVLNYTFRYGDSGTWTVPTWVHVGLLKADPGDGGDFTSEVTGGSYTRVTLSPTVMLHQSTNGYIRNVTDILFPQASANWGNIIALGIFTSNTQGTMMVYASLAATVTINSGEQFRINASNMVWEAR